MLVCADGAPFLLGLPAAMARLGWGGGLAVLLTGFLCILHSATRIVMLHEHGGKRHNRYRELAQAVYGGCCCGVVPGAVPVACSDAAFKHNPSTTTAACRQGAGQLDGAALPVHC